MAATEVEISYEGQELEQLVNRVVAEGTPIVLTVQGVPRAAIISLDDCARLRQLELEARLAKWEAWRADLQALSERILAERDGQPLDVDAIWAAQRADLEDGLE